MKSKAIVALLGVALAGCGGGGGGGGSGSGGTTNVQGMQLSFTPGTLQASFYQGEPPTITVSAKAGGTLPAAGTTVNLRVTDSQGVLEPNVQLVQTDATTYSATIEVAQTLGVGVHTGSIVIRGCQDDPLVCAKPVAGSPWNLSYSFTVRSQTDSHDLARLSQSSNYYGSADHNAMASGALDPARFGRRWTSEQAGGRTPPAVGDGRLFVTEVGARRLASFSERDGSQIWLRTLDGGALSGPAFAEGRVFTITTSSSGPMLRSFEAATGQPLAQAVLRGPISQSSNPVVRNGKVYLCSSAFSLSRFDAATLKEEWTVSLEGNSGDPLCSPAVDDRYVYIYQRSGGFTRQPSLQGFELSNGARAFSIPVPADAYFPPTMQQAPVLGSNGRVYMAAWAPWFGSDFTPRLLAFDTLSRTLAWNVAGARFNSNAVVGADAVYIVNGASLEARSLDTGELLWAWKSGEPVLGDFGSPLVVVGKYAFVSNYWRTFAVDLTTRLQVWRDEGGGPLTLSPNGALYVQRQGHDDLRVFNLQ